MADTLTCFVIAPIGEVGSQIRQDSDDLLDLIIKPALEVFNMDVIRGDHRNESGQIDVDVIKLVQESDLCIVDLTIENVNVYYELGRRDETGKPVILLKSSKSKNLPVDIATRRYIEFDLDDRRALIVSRDKVKEAVQGYIDKGMERSKGTSLFAISEKIDRIERNISRILDASSNPFISTADPNVEEDPETIFRVALIQRNIPMAEAAMSKLQYSMDKITFYDYIVEQVAALGSHKAGEMLINYFESFMDLVDDVNKKIEYFACLVTYLNRSDQESNYIDRIKPIILNIRDEENCIPSEIFNQLNRLHYGIYISTKNEFHLNEAITYLKKAIEASSVKPSYYYNLASCCKSKADVCLSDEEKQNAIQSACKYIREALELSAPNFDEDHLALACRLFHMTDNPEWCDYLELLREISPNKAMLLKRDLK